MALWDSKEEKIKKMLKSLEDFWKKIRSIKVTVAQFISKIEDLKNEDPYRGSEILNEQNVVKEVQDIFDEGKKLLKDNFGLSAKEFNKLVNPSLYEPIFDYRRSRRGFILDYRGEGGDSEATKEFRVSLIENRNLALDDLLKIFKDKVEIYSALNTEISTPRSLNIKVSPIKRVDGKEFELLPKKKIYKIDKGKFKGQYVEDEEKNNLDTATRYPNLKTFDLTEYALEELVDVKIASLKLEYFDPDDNYEFKDKVYDYYGSEKEILDCNPYFLKLSFRDEINPVELYFFEKLHPTENPKYEQSLIGVEFSLSPKQNGGFDRKHQEFLVEFS